MQLNQNPVALCETFDQPNPVTNRSGEMNGDLWGVQRIGGIVNYGQPFSWANAQLDLCGSDVDVQAESDLRVCSGQLRDGTDDNLSGAFDAGGPIALVTNRCLFRFDRDGRRFRLESVHPGHTVEEVAENTGFAYECPAEVPTTPAPSGATLAMLRQDIAPQLAEVYPQFAAMVFGANPE